jgi:hypothetical protein
MVLDPPQLGGQLTANSIAEYEQASPSTDPMSNASQDTPILERPERKMVQEPTRPPDMPSEDQTLASIEKSFASSRQEDGSDPAVFDAPPPAADSAVPPPPPVDDARSAVEEAVESSDIYRPEPINALGASPLNLDLGHNPSDIDTSVSSEGDTSASDDNDNKEQDSQNGGPTNTPPPVPPPLMPPGV